MATFDCAGAPALFGHPDAQIVSCVPFYGSPTLWYVWLSTSAGAMRRFVLTTTPPYTDVGLAAAARFLEEGRLDANRKIDLEGALMFLKAAQARPPGWTEMDGAGDFPGIGPGATFSAAPFRLTLVRGVRAAAPGALPGLGGGHSPSQIVGYEQAVLARSDLDGTWAWHLSSWTEGRWNAHRQIKLQ